MKKVVIFPLFSLLALFVSAADESSFSYDELSSNGPSNWPQVNPTCGGSRQSPIDIELSKLVNGNSSKPLRLLKFHEVAESITVDNEGYSLDVIFKYKDGKPAQLVGGPLKNRYNVEGIHIHWGANDLWGSEHAIDGKRFSAEAHVVSYNQKYASIGDAIKQPDGLAVLGVFLEWSNYRDNPIYDLASKVIKAGSVFTTKKLRYSMNDLIGQEDCNDNEFKIFTYPGSLTTPGCNEVVTWMVSVKPAEISSRNLASLRSLRDKEGNPILTCFRPLQELNGRVVKFQ